MTHAYLCEQKTISVHVIIFCKAWLYIDYAKSTWYEDTLKMIAIISPCSVSLSSIPKNEDGEQVSFSAVEFFTTDLTFHGLILSHDRLAPILRHSLKSRHFSSQLASWKAPPSHETNCQQFWFASFKNRLDVSWEDIIGMDDPRRSADPFIWFNAFCVF